MAIQMHELVYDPSKGRDVVQPFQTLDFDPKAHTTKEAAARALYEALRKASAAIGQNPDREVALWSPDENPFCKGQWGVCWESGPYQWAVGISMEVSGPWGFCEPYYSFDLHFTD